MGQVDENMFIEKCKQLSELEYGDGALYEALYISLENTTGSFALERKKPVIKGSDSLYFTLHYTRVGDEPVLSRSELSLSRKQQIEHMEIDGVNTAGLEQRMQAINWGIDYTDTDFIRENRRDPAKRAEAREILFVHRDLKKLLASNNTQAIGIAVQLEIKYWMHSEFGRSIDLQRNMMHFLPCIKQTFDLTQVPFTLHDSYRLLCGHAVCKPGMNSNLQEELYWYQLNFKEQDMKGQFQLMHLGVFDLVPVIADLPFKEIRENLDSVVKQLQRGETVSLSLENTGIYFTMTADPLRQRAQLFDDKMQEVNPEAVAQLKHNFSNEATEQVKRHRRDSPAPGDDNNGKQKGL